MSLFRRSRVRSTPIPPRRTRQALARARAVAPTAESRHELMAIATRL